MPLDLLIKGMQNFDGNEKPEKLVPSGRIEGEMAFAIDTFNDMVSQIWNDRILIYEEKLENQKLVIQNLHSQIDPHFFSNTLNLIYNLIAINRNDVAKKALILLSSYYRFMCNLDRKLISLKKEIDFICQKQEQKIYVQVTYLLASEETIQREFGIYESVRDNFPKYVVSMDEFDFSRNGIKHKNIREFLLMKEWN